MVVDGAVCETALPLPKRVLVTGGNRGIGLAIVRRLLEEDPHCFVFLGARDRAKGEQAREKVLREALVPEQRLEVLAVDVADEISVQEAANEVRRRCAADAQPLTGIINNAGIDGSAGAGLRQILEVNAHGAKRIVDAFLPLIRPDSGERDFIRRSQLRRSMPSRASRRSRLSGRDMGSDHRSDGRLLE
eukprot:TRINITY_DN111973_c0_g1_i1.p1 TRINITY_DN111973_c0_g1~~TRINITY_DN111973_c0_g1_i1.p1  ORF type:complete len:189 (+),score=36.52 TRINITY_DN111973_c0_g1_i1:127-693(+)